MKNKFKVSETFITFKDLNGKDLNEVINFFKDLNNESTTNIFKFEFTETSGLWVCKVVKYRDETEKEREERLNHEKKTENFRRRLRHEEFLKLKKEFEG